MWNRCYGSISSIRLVKNALLLAKELDNRRQIRKRMLFYSQFAAKGELCFDIGANIGNRTAILAKLGCKVVAVEPQKECFNMLVKKFGKNNQVTLLKKAVAEKAGRKELYTCPADAISSTSKEWIEAVNKSGRYAGFMWNRKETVFATTLDALISEFGMPAFCKIDVEGSESDVLKGLSRPIPCISFEFSYDYLAAAVKCAQRLAKLGRPRFNYSAGESMLLALNEWVDEKQIVRLLKNLNLPKSVVWGDVYARFGKIGGSK